MRIEGRGTAKTSQSQTETLDDCVNICSLRPCASYPPCVGSSFTHNLVAKISISCFGIFPVFCSLPRLGCTGLDWMHQVGDADGAQAVIKPRARAQVRHAGLPRRKARFGMRRCPGGSTELTRTPLSYRTGVGTYHL